MPVYLVLVVGVVVAVTRASARIEQVEGSRTASEGSVSRRDRWERAPGVEKAAFVVLGLAATVWLLLILPIGFAAAAVALAVAVWKRPYLEATLAPVVLVGGLVLVAYDLVIALVRDDGGWGAAVLNAVLFGGLWILVGILLRAAGRADTSGTRATAPPTTV